VRKRDQNENVGCTLHTHCQLSHLCHICIITVTTNLECFVLTVKAQMGHPMCALTVNEKVDCTLQIKTSVQKGRQLVILF